MNPTIAQALTTTCAAIISLLAMWIRFTFTSPNPNEDSHPVSTLGAKEYVLEERNLATGFVRYPPVRDFPSGTAPIHVPHAALLPDTFYSFISQDGLPRRLRLASIGYDGEQSEWSNVVYIEIGTPDTVHSYFSGEQKPVRAIRSNGLNVVSFVHGMGDSLYTIELDDSIQVRFKQQLCKTFGYWVLNGQRVLCP